MDTFTFYSYKGGSGRSLLLTNAARYLASLGKRVVAIDFDFEAPGLHYKMHIGESSERTGDILPERGVVDYLLAATSRAKFSGKLESYVTPIPLPPGTAGKLYLMPAGAAPSGSYWKSLTKLMQRDVVFDSNGTGIAACLELKARIEDELKADFILIDSRTGITELAGLATSLLADKVVCLVINNRESLAGTRAVMRSFGRAPRLKRQAPVQLLPVLSRIPEAKSDTIREVLDFLNEPGPSQAETLHLKRLYVLRVDPELQAEERLHVGGTTIARSPLYQDYLELFNAMVRVETKTAEAAARRHEAIISMKEWLTEPYESRRHRGTTPDSFKEEQIDEGVTLGNYEKRYADLVVYGSGGRSEPLMAAEYADDVKSSDAWRWWQKNTNLRCVIVFGKTKGNPLVRRVFTRGRRGGDFVEREDFDGWIVKWPVSFAALDDPGDRSIEAMLKAVQRGEDSFIGLLVTEWQHSSFVTLHGGAPFRPHRARQILDGFAQVSDPETELRILWRTAPDPFERSVEGFGLEGGSLEKQMTRELHAPLWWRLSVEAKIEFSGSRHGRFRQGNSTAGIELLSRDMMGLWLDEDRIFRNQVRQLFDGDQAHANDELPAYRFSDLFQNRELKFELSGEAPPELVRRAVLDYLSGDPNDQRSRAVWENAREIATEALTGERALSHLMGRGDQHLQTTNLLSAYNPRTCSVTVYRKLVDWASRLIGVDTRPLANVVFLHATVQALCHLGRDLDGRIWEDFGGAANNDINFRPSLMHEAMAQYFSYRLLQRLDDLELMTVFERLNDRQPRDYQLWRRMQHIPIEEVRKVLLRARAGLDDQFWMHSSRQN